ncbi:hypothetical protein SmJEL517_g00965 [Synchytrium microbalum]|uniref:WIBG Mago-binding domain-containing protein n=1 Tax=Synchytrium microbalum TaxID=1806994 RepID=A0A507C7U0_9FUNG|nr:uncharacterized protein SmJEL517_g00965 [Synchytrium microbalum]TPX37117.1 hypothetical protein SmJEL517_g00965 [Synchytrium microbalum]
MSKASGIIELPTPDGQRVIPASRRADGSVRKELRVRAGYTPQEDVGRFTTSKIESSKAPAGYIPGRGIVEANAKAEKSVGQHVYQYDDGGSDEVKSKSAKKNEKRRAAKAMNGITASVGSNDGDHDDVASKGAAVASVSSSKPTTTTTATPGTASAPTSAADTEKKIKALKKKLRQAEQLRDKGDLDALSPEERDKVGKIKSMEDEIGELESMVKQLGI